MCCFVSSLCIGYMLFDLDILKISFHLQNLNVEKTLEKYLAKKFRKKLFIETVIVNA